MGLKILTAPSRVVSKTLETNNIITSYEWFYDTNAAYEARLPQITQFNGFLKEELSSSEKSKTRVDLGAIQQSCRDLVSKYNANSQKMNKKIFKGWSLPYDLKISTCD